MLENDLQKYVCTAEKNLVAQENRNFAVQNVAFTAGEKKQNNEN